MSAEIRTGDKMKPSPEPPPEKKRLWMVGWYSPLQLLQTSIALTISTIFGRHSDHRLMEALAIGDHDKEFYDYTYNYEDDGENICRPDEKKPRDSIWLDYVGDVADGWNSTYAIAYYLAESGRTFIYTDDTGQHKEKTERGSVLIFGGDEVYPTASRKIYKERLVAPYETALRRNHKEHPPHKEHPHVFAIPGNHDWFDSLVSFTRLFTGEGWFAGWRTRQQRSYFALKLPHNWWLLGTDMQLGSDIDGPQMTYFKSLAKHMNAEKEKTGKPPNIILCHAEPHWIGAAQYEGVDPNYNESNLKALEEKLGKDVAVFIAGDLHHYRRHESKDKSTQKITAGGGGAFLHPTHVGLLGRSLDPLVEHGPDEEIKEERRSILSIFGWARKNPNNDHDVSQDKIFELRCSFPSTEVSRRLCWRNLIFPYLRRNASRTFGFMTALLYLLLSLYIIARIDEPALRDLKYQLGYIFGTAIHAALNSPPTLFFMAATIILFIFFTDTHFISYRIIMGGLHALFHIIAAVFIALIVVSFVAYAFLRDDWRFPITVSIFKFYLDLRIVIASLLIMLGGFLIGSLIMGIYLLLSMNLFGRHGNEAFSSLAIEDWKNFLRLRIDKNGNLTIYPIGIRRVPRKWKKREPLTDGPQLVSDDLSATEPELIESPIVIEKAKTVTGAKACFPERKLNATVKQSSMATHE